MTANGLEDLLTLNMVEGLGVTLLSRLLERFGSPEAVLAASRNELEKVEGVGPALSRNISQARKKIDAKAEMKLAEKLGVKIISAASEDYPKSLRRIFDPPLVLYVKGALKEEDALAMAIVGSRRASYYGKNQAERLAGSLAKMGFTIVSGMAWGIDSAAHRGALSAGGRTIAVLGSGLSKPYPKGNENLLAEIAKSGAAVSEFPLNFPPRAENFPRRNRLISGLCLGVVVVEAAERSGSLITARWAMEQGREVFAVPGPIDSVTSRGTHRLIKDGAKLVERVEDVIEELGPLAEVLAPLAEEEKRQTGSLKPEEAKILEALSPSEPKSIEEIIGKTGLSAQAASSVLMVLELKKLVRQLTGKRFVRA
jgi:DNA processing protein